MRPRALLHICLLIPQLNIYSNPVVYQGISNVCALGVATTGGSCSSSPQGDRRRFKYVVAFIAFSFLHPEIDSIRDFMPVPVRLSRGSLPRTGCGFGGQSRTRTDNLPPCQWVCFPISTFCPYWAEHTARYFPKRLGNHSAAPSCLIRAGTLM